MDEKENSVTVMNLKAGFEEWILAELAPVIESTRQLPGCLSFDWYRVMRDRRTLLLVETWESGDLRRCYLESNLRAELNQLLARALSHPSETLDLEEVGSL